MVANMRPKDLVVDIVIPILSVVDAATLVAVMVIVVAVALVVVVVAAAGKVVLAVVVVVVVVSLPDGVVVVTPAFLVVIVEVVDLVTMVVVVVVVEVVVDVVVDVLVVIVVVGLTVEEVVALNFAMLFFLYELRVPRWLRPADSLTVHEDQSWLHVKPEQAAPSSSQRFLDSCIVRLVVSPAAYRTASLFAA